MASSEDYIDQIAKELMASQQPKYGPPIDLGQLPTDYPDSNPSVAPNWITNIERMSDQYHAMPSGPMMGGGQPKPMRWR